MTATNEENLTKVANDINSLRQYIMQSKPENRVYPNAGENITVIPTSKQATDATARCNALLTTIKADVLALESI